MLILDLWGISFHAVVVFGLGKNFLFKSILGRCDAGDNFFSSLKAPVHRNNNAPPEMILTHYYWMLHACC